MNDNDEEFLKILAAVNLVIKVIVKDRVFFERFMREMWCELRRADRLAGDLRDGELYKKEEKTNVQKEKQNSTED